MANIQISQLPAAGSITGTELVPVVQNGVTVQTTTGAIAASPSQTQTFLTKNNEPSLPNSRYLSATTGIGLTDGGAQSYCRISLNGASGSLESAGNGIIAKTGGAAVTPRTLTASGNGISITDGDGVAGNPTFQLTGIAAAIANASGTGMLAIVGGSTIAGRQITGTASQIDVANGNGSGNPTLSIADDAVLPGVGGVVIPKGSTAQQPLGTNGQFRFNTDTQTFDGYSAGSWRQFSVAGGVSSFSAGSTGFTPSTPTSGNVILGGTLNAASGGTGANTLTGYVYGNGTGAMTAALTIPNSGLTYSAITIGSTTVDLGDTITTLSGVSISGSSNTLSSIGNASLTYSSITINGNTVSLGGSTTVTATATNPLTIGTGLTGTSYDGSAAVTIGIDTAVVATLSGTQTFTNKSISGSTNTLTNIPNSALTNSSLTIGSTAISLGATSLTLAGLTSVTLTQDPTADLQAATKQYVDNLVSTGLTFHAPTQAATTQSLAATTGGTVTYNNGTAGVGATITLSVALTTLDGYSLSNTNRILVKDEVNQAYNGVYTWATGGTVLTRATDADTYGTGVNQLSQNDYFFVQNGTVNKGSSYVVTTVGTITFGTTAITFAEFSNSQVYSAGTGLTLTGTTFSITNTGVTNASYGTASSVPTIAINAQGQITSASNTAIAINGNQITSGTVGVAYGGTNLSSYTAGDMLYATGSTTLAKLNIGAANYVLTSSGTAPQYVAQSTLSVGSATTATTATTATNLAGGVASQIPYQTASGATSFIANGTAGQVLTSAGTGTPTWSGISGGTF